LILRAIVSRYLTMRIAFRWLLLCGALIAQTTQGVPAVSAPSAPSLPSIPLATPSALSALKQWQGSNHFDYNERRQFYAETALTQQQWEGLWFSVKKTAPQGLKVATEMGLIIYVGQRTAGYEIHVLNAYEKDRHFVIEYTETGLKPGVGYLAVMVEPWVIAIVPRSKLPVIFERK
jgi:hypothetical protein